MREVPGDNGSEELDTTMSTHTIVTLNGKSLPLPLFIPSLSTVSAPGLQFYRLLGFLRQQELMLVSAYDLTEYSIASLQKRREGLLMLDSGGYELRHTKYAKPWAFSQVVQSCVQIKPDVMLSLDDPRDLRGFNVQLQQLLKGHELARTKIRKDHLDRELYFEYVLPGRDPVQLQSVLNMVMQIHTKPIPIIGIAEAYLGASLQQRVQVLAQLLEIVHLHTDDPPLIHILGCGDITAMHAYSRLGVSLFDGTRWYRSLLIKSSRKPRYEQYPLPADPKAQETLLQQCRCRFCKGSPKRSLHWLLEHNLFLYQQCLLQLHRGRWDSSLTTSHLTGEPVQVQEGWFADKQGRSLWEYFYQSRPGVPI